MQWKRTIRIEKKIDVFFIVLLDVILSVQAKNAGNRNKKSRNIFLQFVEAKSAVEMQKKFLV
jgi:hypothetical protein